MILRNLFLIFLFIPFLFSCTSSQPTAQQEKSLQKVEEFPELEKPELYDRSLEWVVRNYNSANDVIQLKDPEDGQIIGRGIGSASFDVGFQRHFQYTMIIDIKDGKIRTRYENIQSIDMNGVAGPNMNMQWGTVKEYFNGLNQELYTFISNYENNDGDDW